MNRRQRRAQAADLKRQVRVAHVQALRELGKHAAFQADVLSIEYDLAGVPAAERVYPDALTRYLPVQGMSRDELLAKYPRDARP